MTELNEMVLPVVWSVVHRVLQVDRQLAEDELVERVTPSGLIQRGGESRSRHVGPSVRALETLGLLESVDGRVRLTTPDLDEAAFRFEAARRLLAVPEGADPWEERPESKRLEYDLQVAVSWFCLQGIDSGLSKFDAADARLIKQLGAERNLLRDTAPYNTLERWVEWLGLGGFTRVAGIACLVPDPTLLVRFELDSLIPSGTYLSMSEFLERTAILFPWLPHGALGKQVAAGLREVPDDSAGQSRVPECLSLALSRLEVSRELTLDTGDDPRARVLLSLGDGDQLPVARVSRL